jgi:hypothetical protein
MNRIPETTLTRCRMDCPVCWKPCPLCEGNGHLLCGTTASFQIRLKCGSCAGMGVFESSDWGFQAHLDSYGV